MSYFAGRALRAFWRRVGKSDARRLKKQSPPKGAEIEQDISYIDDGDPMHKLDVYYPQGCEGLLPTIFYIHGGGWIYGSKELSRNICMTYAARGFAVVNVNYRLVPGTDLAGQVSDIFMALKWLGENAAEHHCDLERVFLSGDSAGGHYSSLAAAISVEPALLSLYNVKKLPFAIKAVAATHIAPDVSRVIIGMRSVDREIQLLLFGKKPESNLVFYKSTIYTAAKPDTYPPILIVTSRADQLYPHSMQLIEHLRSNKYRFEAITADPTPHSGHVFNVLYPEREDSRALNDRIAAFFLNVTTSPGF